MDPKDIEQFTENIQDQVNKNIENAKNTARFVERFDEVASKIERELAKHGDAKLREKIRDAFQANYRAALNLLSSMTAEERKAIFTQSMPEYYARRTAREACIATWGEDAVNAALGDGS